MSESLVIPEKQAQLNAMGRTLARTVREYFKDPAHRREFEAWYLDRYGKPYVWKTINEKEKSK